MENVDEERIHLEVRIAREFFDEVMSDQEDSNSEHTDVDSDDSSIDPVKGWEEDHVWVKDN